MKMGDFGRNVENIMVFLELNPRILWFFLHLAENKV